MLGIAPEEAGGTSGLFNMMRNLGGAIGTAAIETFFTKREQFHSAIITPEVSLLEPANRSRLADLQQYLRRTASPILRARRIAPSSPSVIQFKPSRTIMGYADCFALLGVVLVVAAVMIALLKKGAAPGASAH